MGLQEISILRELSDISSPSNMIDIENVLLGISPVSICSWPTFRNPVSVPSSKAGSRLIDIFTLTPCSLAHD